MFGGVRRRCQISKSDVKMLEAKECQQGMLGASGMGLTKALLLLTQSASIIAMVTSPTNLRFVRDVR